MTIDYIEQAIRMCQSRMAKRANAIADVQHLLNKYGRGLPNSSWNRIWSRTIVKQRERHIAQQTDKHLLGLLYKRQQHQRFVDSLRQLHKDFRIQ